MSCSFSEQSYTMGRGEGAKRREGLGGMAQVYSSQK